ncbi:MAG: YeeE/YedE family protein, partial [Gammaproteobacteria bacterium]
LLGRVLGRRGSLGGLLVRRRGEIGWRASFLSGLLLAPAMLALLAPGLIRAPRIDAGTVTLIAAGLLVGIGTRYGSGCTSGHGVCGLSRLSPRSLAATLAFMAAGFATVYIIRHVI